MAIQTEFDAKRFVNLPRKFSLINVYINMTFSRLRSNTCETRIADVSADDEDRFNVFINLIAADVRSKA